MTDKQILSRVGIKLKDLAKLHGYKDVDSFYRSRRKGVIISASAEIVRKVAQSLLNK